MWRILKALIGKKGEGVGGFATDIREAIKGKELDPNKILELIKIQSELTKVEAQHRTIFVAGWRPFIGWVCGIALLYNFVIRDLLAWILEALISNGDISKEIMMPPALQMEHLMTILLGLLGLGGLRTYEKLKIK